MKEKKKKNRESWRERHAEGVGEEAEEANAKRPGPGGSGAAPCWRGPCTHAYAFQREMPASQRRGFSSVDLAACIRLPEGQVHTRM